MFLVRDIMHCKPGKARPMVEKFVALSKVTQPMGFSAMRVMTDVSGERFWTVIAEVEVADLGEYATQSRKAMDTKELKAIMKDYHDLVESGRREIYMLEK
jgi:hypothetical protein